MGLVQKIFYFHAPVGIAMFMSAFVCGIASAIYLFTRRRSADHVAIAAAELTAILGIIVLITGPLWARKAWGVWWQWDARLTSSLVLWLIFMAYLLLQAVRRARIGSARRRRRDLWHGERSVRVLVRQRLANGASEDVGRADAAAWHARTVLVLRGGVPRCSTCSSC